MDMPNNTITLYTAQTDTVCQVIERDGTCYSRAEYVKNKYGESAKIFLTAYGWFAEEAQKYVSKPAQAEFPYWAFGDLYSMDKSGSNVLKLEVPLDEAVFFDMYDWNRIMQLSYIGDTLSEEKAFRRELEMRGLSEVTVMLSTFYPEENKRIRESWRRLFRHHERIKAGDIQNIGELQAGLWQIKKEWIVNR